MWDFKSFSKRLRIEDFQSFDKGFGFLDFLDLIEDFFQPLATSRSEICFTLNFHYPGGGEKRG